MGEKNKNQMLIEIYTYNEDHTQYIFKVWLPLWANSTSAQLKRLWDVLWWNRESSKKEVFYPVSHDGHPAILKTNGEGFHVVVIDKLNPLDLQSVKQHLAEVQETQEHISLRDFQEMEEHIQIALAFQFSERELLLEPCCWSGGNRFWNAKLKCGNFALDARALLSAPFKSLTSTSELRRNYNSQN